MTRDLHMPTFDPAVEVEFAARSNASDEVDAEFAVQPNPAEEAKAEFSVQPNSRPAVPTADIYGYLQARYSQLNERLFGNALPNSIITLNQAALKPGYLFADAFVNQRDRQTAHEISLNPTYFDKGSEVENLSVLAYLMVRLDRHLNGPPNRKKGKGAAGYHDRVVAAGMIRVGLMPIKDGDDTGSTTGYRISYSIVDGGPFDVACRELLGDDVVNDWRGTRGLTAADTNAPAESLDGSSETPARKPRNTRTCFVCSGCDLRAWARRSASLSCNHCTQALVPK